MVQSKEAPNGGLVIAAPISEVERHLRKLQWGWSVEWGQDQSSFDLDAALAGKFKSVSSTTVKVRGRILRDSGACAIFYLIPVDDSTWFDCRGAGKGPLFLSWTRLQRPRRAHMLFKERVIAKVKMSVIDI